MCLDAEKEYEIRAAALKTKIAGVDKMAIPGVAVGRNVFETEWFFANKEDFAAVMGVSGATYVKALEVKFALIDYAGFTDSGDGRDKCPVLWLDYDIFLFWQFSNVRADGTRSSNDFTALIMNMQEEFFRNRRLDEKTRIVSFTQLGRVVKRKTTEYLPDDKVKGSFVNLRVRIEVR